MKATKKERVDVAHDGRVVAKFNGNGGGQSNAMRTVREVAEMMNTGHGRVTYYEKTAFAKIIRAALDNPREFPCLAALASREDIR